jgi:hypothetical protein
LHQEYVTGADVFAEANEDVFVAELKDLTMPRWRLQVIAYGESEVRMGIAAENSQLLVHRYALLGHLDSTTNIA